MDAKEPSLRIEVDDYDLDELRALLPPGAIRVESEAPPDAHGEPVLIAIVVLAPLVISALAAWALKQRRKGSLEINAEKVHPDGTRESVRATVKFAESTTSADVVEQLLRGMKLDASWAETIAGLGG